MLVEDELHNLFGGYLDKPISSNQPLNDINSYLFSLRKDGVFNPKRFPKNQIGYAFKIWDEKSEALFVFGSSLFYSKDIAIYKKHRSSGYCSQECFDYYGEKHALTGKMWYAVKRVVVFQMI